MPKQHDGFANQIMVGYNDLQTPVTLYLPGYLSVKVNNIQSFQVGDSIATLNLSLYLSIYFGKNLSKQFVNKCCQQLEFGPSRDDQFKIKLNKKLKQQMLEQEGIQEFEDDSQEQQQQEEAVNIVEKPFDQATGLKTFSIRKSFQVSLIPYPYFTPFQIHDLSIYFEIRKIKLTTFNNKKLQVKINLMSTDRFSMSQRLKCMNFTQTGSYGQYQLAQGFLIFENTVKRPEKNLPDFFRRFPFSKTGIREQIKKQKNYLEGAQKQDSNNVEQAINYMMKYLDNTNFQYASFHFPMYRKPLVSFTSIYLPLWVLSFITLAIYFSQNHYAVRVIAIATLNLAYVPTVQLVRQQIPQTPKLTIIQFFIYLQIVSTCLLLLQSNKISGDDEYVFQPFNNGYFLGSLIISLAVFALPLITLVIYKILQCKIFNVDIRYEGENQVNLVQDGQNEQEKKEGKKVKKENNSGFKFNPKHWNFNRLANQYFYEKKKIYSRYPQITKKINDIRQNREKKVQMKVEKIKSDRHLREDIEAIGQLGLLLSENKNSYYQKLKEQGMNEADLTYQYEKRQDKIKKFAPAFQYFLIEHGYSYQYKILMDVINSMKFQNSLKQKRIN